MQRAYPLLFVFLWSTGFIGAKLGLPDAEPLTFLLHRYGLVVLLMLGIVWLTRAPWPATPAAWRHIAITGLLVHALYLGGVFIAIDHGLSAGITALIVGMQPLLTAACAPFLLGEPTTRRQWAGLVAGFSGVALVLSDRLGSGVSTQTLLPAFIALLGITLGTLYQKRFCPRFDLRTGAVIQFVPSALVTGIAATLFETGNIHWSGEFTFALFWLVLVLSIGAISLLNLLLREGSAVNVASLFYLTPPTTTLIAWLLFDEKMGLTVIFGMLIAVAGVYLASRPAR